MVLKPNVEDCEEMQHLMIQFMLHAYNIMLVYSSNEYLEFACIMLLLKFWMNTEEGFTKLVLFAILIFWRENWIACNFTSTLLHFSDWRY